MPCNNTAKNKKSHQLIKFTIFDRVLSKANWKWIHQYYCIHGNSFYETFAIAFYHVATFESYERNSDSSRTPYHQHHVSDRDGHTLVALIICSFFANIFINPHKCRLRLCSKDWKGMISTVLIQIIQEIMAGSSLYLNDAGRWPSDTIPSISRRIDMGWSSYDCCMKTNERFHHEIQVEHKIELKLCLTKGKTYNMYAVPRLYSSADCWPLCSSLVVSFGLQCFSWSIRRWRAYAFHYNFSDVFNPVEEGAVKFGN